MTMLKPDTCTSTWFMMHRFETSYVNPYIVGGSQVSGFKFYWNYSRERDIMCMTKLGVGLLVYAFKNLTNKLSC